VARYTNVDVTKMEDEALLDGERRIGLVLYAFFCPVGPTVVFGIQLDEE
jgi:hypothetical protein